MPRSAVSRHDVAAPPCFDRNAVVDIRSANATLRSVAHMKLAGGGFRVSIRENATALALPSPRTPREDQKSVQFLTAAVSDATSFAVSSRGTFFEAWSAACHEGDASFASAYEAAAYAIVEADDTNSESDDSARVALKVLLPAMCAMCEVNAYLWETRNLIPSSWSPDRSLSRVVLLRVEDGEFSCVHPRRAGAVQAGIVALMPAEFSACVAKGTARPPEAWGKGAFQSTAADDVSSEGDGEQQLRDILYPSLDTGCGCVALLKATIKVAELRPTKLYLIAGVIGSLVLLAFAISNLAVLDSEIAACCEGDSGDGCGWDVSVIRNVTNASVAQVCLQGCAPDSVVLATARDLRWNGAPGQSLGATMQFVTGSAVITLGLAVAVTLLTTRSIAIRSQRVIFCQLLRGLRVLGSLCVLALSLWYVAEIIRAAGENRSVKCTELPEDARLTCLGLADTCGATVAVTVGPTARGRRELIALAVVLVVVCLANLAAGLLPTRPSDEVIEELRGSAPDISVFRVNTHCPDGPTQHDTATLQQEIYMKHFDDDDWEKAAGVHSSASSDPGSTAPSSAVGEDSPAPMPTTLSESGDSDTLPQADPKAAAKNTVSHGAVQSNTLFHSDVKRRVKAVDEEAPFHSVMPSVNSAIDRIAYRVSRTSAPATGTAGFPRPEVDAVAAKIDSRIHRAPAH